MAVGRVTCGIDWAEGHHDIAVVGQNGDLVAKRRIVSESVQGFAELTTLLAEAGDSSDDPMAVAIGRPVDCWSRRCAPAAGPCIRSTRWRWPATASGIRCRVRNLTTLTPWFWRTFCVLMPTGTASCPPTAIWPDGSRCWRGHTRTPPGVRTRACNELRSVLREYYPGFLQAFAGVTTNLITREARAVLALAPTPTMAASLSKRQIAAALRRSGRQRGIDALTAQIHSALHVPQLRQPAPLEDAMGMQALALLGSLDTECASTESLGQAVITAFEQHPDHVIITSFPGLGDLDRSPHPR